jgi:hypothetical protein
MLGEIKGTITLHASRGTEGWKDTTGGLLWKFRAKTPGDYQVVAITRGNSENPDWFKNHDIRITVGNSSAAGTVGVRDMAADGPNIQSVRSVVGRIRIDRAGEYTVAVVAEKVDATAKRGLALIAIELSPV